MPVGKVSSPPWVTMVCVPVSGLTRIIAGTSTVPGRAMFVTRICPLGSTAIPNVSPMDRNFKRPFSPTQAVPPSALRRPFSSPVHLPSCCPLHATGSHRERLQRARAPRRPPWTARTGRWPYGLRVGDGPLAWGSGESRADEGGSGLLLCALVAMALERLSPTRGGRQVGYRDQMACVGMSRITARSHQIFHQRDGKDSITKSEHEAVNHVKSQLCPSFRLKTLHFTCR